jgi:hypothetical protein
VQNKAAKFAQGTGSSGWESLAQRRKVAGIRALYIAYNGEWAWKDIADRLQVPHYLSGDDHYWKIGARKQRTDVGKFSSVNRTTADWNQLPVEVFGFPSAEAYTFSKKVRKVAARKGGEVRGKEV